MTPEKADAEQQWAGMNGYDAHEIIAETSKTWEYVESMMAAWNRANSPTILIDAMKNIRDSPEAHPCFMGYETPDDDVNTEGGDAAFVTLDIARVANDALGGVGE
jgi:hypothetical protein